MTRFLMLVISCCIANSVSGEDRLPALAEKFLQEGLLTGGEAASLVALRLNPNDDEARFGLGVIQVVQAIENLGRSLYAYGAVSENANMDFFRLPVPNNDSPSSISLETMGRVLDTFAADLNRAETTLAGVSDAQVKLRLELSKISFDFTSSGKDRTSLPDLIIKLSGGVFEFNKANSKLLVHFDYSDVVGIRAYCHLLCAMVEVYRTFDLEPGFAFMGNVFPNVEEPTKKFDSDPNELKVVDAARLRRARLHFVAACELSRMMWKLIRNETDNDYEWLPNEKQTDLLVGLPMSPQRVNTCLVMIEESERLMKGERLLPGSMFGPLIKEGYGLNLQKLMDDPPAKFWDEKHIQQYGKYFEVLDSKNQFHGNVVLWLSLLVMNPYEFAFAVRVL